MDKRKTLVLTVLVVSVSIPSVVNKVNAHTHPCHGQHSCPSDWGTYVCGDTGNLKNCPPTPSLYDRYMVKGCNAQRAGDWQEANKNYNSALLASRNPKQSRKPYQGGKPLSFYAEQSIARKNQYCN